MSRVRLIHWNADEAAECAAALEKAGYDVEAGPIDRDGLTALGTDPPAAVVIDLTRLHAQGRDLGILLRKQKATRHVPLVFVEGAPEKIERVRQHLPDAVYTTWGRIGGSLGRALKKPPTDPVVPQSTFAAYSGTPLWKKLGIKPGSVVALIEAPEGFDRTLGELPEGAVLRSGLRGRCDLAIWFTRSSDELRRRVARMGDFAGKDGLWIVWPKKTSGVPSDLTQAVVRKIGLASRLVDYRVCSIDGTWSGLRFTQRKRG